MKLNYIYIILFFIYIYVYNYNPKTPDEGGGLSLLLYASYVIHKQSLCVDLA